MKKKVILIPIIILLVLIFVTGGVFAYLYFATDVFKSDKEMFTTYISQNLEIIDLFKKNELHEYSQKQQTTPYSGEGSIKMSIPEAGAYQQGASDIAKIQNTSITFIENVDNANNQVYTNIKANYSDTESLSAEFVQKNDIFAIKLNEIMPGGYLGIQNNNLKDVARKLGLDENSIQYIPEKIVTKPLVTAPIFTDAELTQIKEKYLKILSDNLTDDMFSKQTVNDETIYVLTLTSQKVTTIVKNILSTFYNDEMILSKIRTYLTSDGNTTIEQANNYIAEFQQEIQNILNEQSENILNNDDTITQDNDLFDNNQEGLTNSTSNNKVYIKVHTINKKLIKTELTNNQANTISKQESSNQSIYSYSVIKTEKGIRFEIDTNSMSEPYVIALEKNVDLDHVKYSFNILTGSTPNITLNVDFLGINTDVVQESAELTIKEYMSLDELNTGDGINQPMASATFTYVNKKTFGPGTVANSVENNKIMLINTAPNADTVKNFLNQISSRLSQIENAKKVAAGFTNETREPFSQYIPAIIPVGATYMLNNFEKIASIDSPGMFIGIWKLMKPNESDETFNDPNALSEDNSTINVQDNNVVNQQDNNENTQNEQSVETPQVNDTSSEINTDEFTNATLNESF